MAMWEVISVRYENEFAEGIGCFVFFGSWRALGLASRQEWTGKGKRFQKAADVGVQVETSFVNAR